MHAPTLTHTLPAKLGQDIEDFRSSAGRFGAPIDSLTQTSLSGLRFSVEHEDRIEHRQAMTDSDPLKRIGHGADYILRVIGFAFQNDAARYNGVSPFLLGERADNNRNFERAGHTPDQDIGVGHERPQLRAGMIDQALDVFVVKPAGNDNERPFAVAGSDPARCDKARHDAGKRTLSAALRPSASGHDSRVGGRDWT